jgi:hypothetical protein
MIKPIGRPRLIDIGFLIFMAYAIWYAFIQDHPITPVTDLPTTYACENRGTDVYLCTSPNNL